MSLPVAILDIVSPGLGASLQDHGRRGWKRFGVPPGGALDDHAAGWANVLLDNPIHTPVLELLLHGAVLRVLAPLTVAITGAATVPRAGRRWQTFDFVAGDEIAIPPPESGVWTYLAVQGDSPAPRWFGSVSVFPRGGLGAALSARQTLYRASAPPPPAPPGIGVRLGRSPRATRLRLPTRPPGVARSPMGFVLPNPNANASSASPGVSARAPIAPATASTAPRWGCPPPACPVNRSCPAPSRFRPMAFPS